MNAGVRSSVVRPWDDEAGAAVGRVRDGDGAARPLCDDLDDEEAEPALGGVLRREVRLEHVVGLRRVEPWAVVIDLEQRVAIALADRDRDRAVLRRVARVGDEVENDALDVRARCCNEHTVLDRDVEGARRSDERLEGGPERDDDVGEPDRVSQPDPGLVELAELSEDARAPLAILDDGVDGFRSSFLDRCAARSDGVGRDRLEDLVHIVGDARRGARDDGDLARACPVGVDRAEAALGAEANRLLEERAQHVADGDGEIGLALRPHPGRTDVLEADDAVHLAAEEERVVEHRCDPEPIEVRGAEIGRPRSGPRVARDDHAAGQDRIAIVRPGREREHGVVRGRPFGALVVKAGPVERGVIGGEDPDPDAGDLERARADAQRGVDGASEVVRLLELEMKDVEASSLPSGEFIALTFDANVHTNAIPAKVSTIGEAPVKVVDGRPVLIRDVASVEDSGTPATQSVAVNGKDAVYLNVLRVPGGSTIQIVDEVKRIVGGIKDLPPGMEVKAFFDQSTFVRTTYNGLKREIIQALILIAIVILVFLQSVRGTLIVSVAILTYLVVALLVSGCASAVPTLTSAPLSTSPTCEELAFGNGGPTDPNPNEVRRTDCR